MKTSIIYSFKKEEVKKIIEESNTVKEVLNKVGLKSAGSNWKTLYNFAYENSLEKELDLLKKRSKKAKTKMANLCSVIDDSDLFCENSPHSRNTLKKRILKNKLIEYKCFECGNTGEWNGKPITLQLEHKNGISNDNRLENLCFLCPNCHSQTETYAGKSAEKTRSKNRIKSEKQKKIQERIDFLDNLDTSKFGWIKKVQDEWKVSHTQVKRWIKINYPDFKYFERSQALVQSQVGQ